MKPIALVLPISLLPFLASAQLAEEPSAAHRVLSNLKANEIPAKPVSWISPQGPIVLHGDFFGDGRHLALVASDGTTLAQAGEGQWRVLGRWDVLPAWVPAGEDPEELGYEKVKPPEVPFVLRDLSGDGVPEILIAFDNDGERIGYAIARKKGDALDLLDVSSASNEPRGLAGFLKIPSVLWSGKSWDLIDNFYRWSNEGLTEVGSLGKYSGSPDEGSLGFIAVRHLPDGSDQAFHIREQDGLAIVLSGTWNGGFEIKDATEFAKVRSIVPEGASSNILHTKALLFERMTGVPGELGVTRAESEGFKQARGGLKLEIEGSEEAKALFGEKPAPAGKP